MALRGLGVIELHFQSFFPEALCVLLSLPALVRPQESQSLYPCSGPSSLAPSVCYSGFPRRDSISGGLGFKEEIIQGQKGP